MDTIDQATKFGQILLSIAREQASTYENQDRLPDWINQTNIRVGRFHHTWVFLFTPSIENGDNFEFHDEVASLLELLTDIPDEYLASEITPAHEVRFTPEDHDGIHIIGGGSTDSKSPILDNTMDSPNIFDVKNGHHVPFIVTNTLIRFTPHDSPIATGYVPYAILIHDYDFNKIDTVLKIFRNTVSDYIDYIYHSKVGDYYERRKGKNIQLVTSKKDSVIVLGDYDGGDNEEELHRFRDELEAMGYRAALIKELPADESQSLPQKVKMWCLTARFVVVIDREPSGHIREYSELTDEDIPLALLRETNSGSTYMIGHEHLTDKFVELSEFDFTPNEVTQDVIDWVEDFVAELSEMYEKEYPWR